MNSLLEKLFIWWCKNFHDTRELTRPVNGKYTCLVCGREYKCPYR